MRRDQPENLDGARSELLVVGDFLLLVGREQGSHGHMDRGRERRQGALERAEVRSQNGHTLGSLPMNRSVGHVCRKW